MRSRWRTATAPSTSRTILAANARTDDASDAAGVSSENSYPNVEDAVRLLYEAYPYPAANAGSETLPELAALLQMFFFGE